MRELYVNQYQSKVQYQWVNENGLWLKQLKAFLTVPRITVHSPPPSADNILLKLDKSVNQE